MTQVLFFNSDIFTVTTMERLTLFYLYCKCHYIYKTCNKFNGGSCNDEELVIFISRGTKIATVKLNIKEISQQIYANCIEGSGIDRWLCNNISLILLSLIWLPLSVDLKSAFFIRIIRNFLELKKTTIFLRIAERKLL